MTKDQFKEKVFEKLHEKGYSDYKTDEELREAIEEYADIIDDGFSRMKEYGEVSGIRYAANNISMCI